MLCVNYMSTKLEGKKKKDMEVARALGIRISVSCKEDIHVTAHGKTVKSFSVDCLECV